MKTPAALLTSALLAALTLGAAAQKMQTPAGEAPGPWLLGTIGVGKNADGTVQTTALKGLAIKVGAHGEAAVAYDLDLCRMAGAWTGPFTTPMNLMSRGEFPTAMGAVAFTSGSVAGFISGEAKAPWKDPRAEPFGPLPQGQARFKGFYVNGDKTILKWDIGGTEVLEMPEYSGDGTHIAMFARLFDVGPSETPLTIVVRSIPSDLMYLVKFTKTPDGRPSIGIEEGDNLWIAVATASSPPDSKFELLGNLLCFVVPAHSERTNFRLGLTRYGPDAFTLAEKGEIKFAPFSRPGALTPNIKGGSARWPESVVTQGELAKDTTAAYVVDTIKLPDPNPWNAPMFLGGLDFFPDGRAAVCTFHGDVFIVSGLDAKLEKVVWKRFASGLYHALGLKIVNGEIYVTCRDGLWRLRDLNGDGECDFYEAFNHDVMGTPSFHEFVFDLQTDPAGNFYFAKAGPVKNGGRGFDEICAHHGSLFRVSPDGKKFEVVATGFRAPNGLGCGPHGELTSGDNEGTWTPACKINWIKPGGFYGVVPLAHRTPAPTDYDRPLCWLPKRVDNSGGGQVWVKSDKWGPWKDQLLHLSYGTCSLFGVMREEVANATGRDGTPLPSAGERSEAVGAGSRSRTGTESRPYPPAALMQGGVTRFPVNFQSGTMRARFNPADGQLYVAGLRGWQTTGVKNGAFQRVRYNPDAPVRMPIGLHATKRGVRLDFTCALDAASAGDPQSWNVEVWNYLWSSAYGSPEISTFGSDEKPTEPGKDDAMQYTSAQLGQKKHDPLAVKSAVLSADKKSVFLEIPDLKPVMQMQIKFDLKSADGAALKSEVINTIHALWPD